MINEALQPRRPRSDVVRPLSKAAGRRCARPGCPAPAQATLSFRYQDQQANLDALFAQPAPETYDLCTTHADRTNPPVGWELVDRRPSDDAAGVSPPDADDQDTVAVLAAALKRVEPEPEPDPEPEPKRGPAHDAPAVEEVPPPPPPPPPAARAPRPVLAVRDEESEPGQLRLDEAFGALRDIARSW